MTNRMIGFLSERQSTVPHAGRLGRHVEHDSRSKSFRTTHSVIKTATHTRHCAPFDQGNLGSCTGNAMAGALMTGPLFKAGRHLTEADAVRFYTKATELDEIPGQYPPDDTGSSGLAVAKAAKSEGLLSEYHHAFTVHEALAALSAGPIIVGTNWYDGFDSPVGTKCVLAVSGEARGGHEYVLDAIDVEHGFVHMTNSWGGTWGLHGGAIMSFKTLERLLDEQGDATVLHA